MSWQLGAFLVLGLALAGGFAWYERVRPDARIIALVATMAAFAALGRIAFAAVPNVKPTTDIVLVSGYALGGGPGFAVGALAGLASNFFFGQGPWTPWQMAAWGATGMSGAGLAWLTGLRARPPRIGRVTLAVVCGVVGFAFTVVQDVGDWVTYSDHSSAQLAAYVGQGLGFDAIHATGCVVFALLLGPSLIRSMQRFARRLQVRWVPPGTVFPLLAGLTVLATLLPGLRGPAPARAAGSAGSVIAYLQRAENPDGGFGAVPGQPSAGLYSGWAALGLAAAGHDPLDVSRTGRSVIAYTRAGTTGALDTGSLERTILVVRAAGLPATSFAGHDLVAELEQRLRGNGSLGGTVNLTAFGLLALRSAGVAPSAPMAAWLASQQDRDGGYGFAGAGPGASSDIDDTGAVLEALGGVPGGGVARARARAVRYLRGRQDGDGGFPSQPGMGSNAQSTAWAVQGLLAAGVDPFTLHRAGAPSPISYLQSLIGSDGAVAYARGQSQTPVWVTGEALMALEEKPLPLAPLTLPISAAARPAVRRARHPARSAHGVQHRGRRRGRGRLRPGGAESLGVPALTGVAGLATAVLLAPMGLG